MNEVSCRLFSYVMAIHRDCAVPRERLLRGTSLDWAFIADPRHRVDWDSWVQIMDNCYAAMLEKFGSDEEILKFIRGWLDADYKKHFFKLARFVLSPASLYLRFVPLELRGVYRHIEFDVKEHSPDIVRLRVEIPAPYRPSPTFFHGMKFAYTYYPCLIGLGPARIESVRIAEREGLYHIHLPQSKTILNCLRFARDALPSTFSFFRVLREQNAELTASYSQVEQQTTNLRNVVAASSDGIAVVRDGRILHANPALARILRARDADALTGQSTDTWAAPAELSALRTWAASRPPDFERREIRLTHSAGPPVHVELSAPRDIMWENQPATLWLLRDITERHALESALTQARQREQTSLARDLHDGLGQHLTGLAFKLKALETRLARAGSLEAPLAGEMVELANRATTQARDLAHGLAPVDLDPQGLVPALRLLCANVSQLFQISCTLTAPKQPPALSRDTANQLYRAAQEAITNAHRHGHAKVILLTLEFDSPGRLTLTIDDHGTGLPTSPTSTPPAGFGVKIMRHRLASIGGHFHLAKSPAAPGVRVTLVAPLDASATHAPASLPAAHRAALAPSLARLPLRSTSSSTSAGAPRILRVVIVDDHTIVRAGLIQLLNQTTEFTVCGEADTSARAETLCATLAPHVLITDMLLGETTALATIRRLRAAHPAMRIVVLSMYSRDLYADAAQKAGADAYVMKQSSPDELLAALRSATAR